MTESSADKCIWCHGTDGRLQTITVPVTDRLGRNLYEEEVVVHPHHAPDTRSFLRFAARYGKTFVVAMISGTVVAVALAVFITTSLADTPRGEDYWMSLLYGPYAILYGFFVVRFPFSTPETVKWLGLKRSKLLAHAGGWMIVGVGLWLTMSALH